METKQLFYQGKIITSIMNKIINGKIYKEIVCGDFSTAVLSDEEFKKEVKEKK